MLILGCDIGSEIHYARAIDTRGRELSKSAFSFSITEEGFKSVLDWALKFAEENDYAMWLKCMSYYIKHDGSVSRGSKVKLIKWH